MPTADTILTKLCGETHPWIDTESTFFIAFSQAVRAQLDYLATLTDGLSTYLDSGRPLRRLAESWLIFPANGASNADVLGYLAQVFEIHEQRGTMPGISFDIEVLFNHTPNIAFYTDMEWYLGINFPNQQEYLGELALPDGRGESCVDQSGNVGAFNVLCMGIDTAIIVQYLNDTHRTDRAIREIILRHFVPPRVAIELLSVTEPPADLLMLEKAQGFFGS